MPKITLDEFCSHWVSRTSTRVMASRLEFNVFDFATAAGDYTRQQFLSSFASGGFNGSKWAPRTSKWGKRFTHPLMNDTGTLARSIQSEAGRTDIVDGVRTVRASSGKAPGIACGLRKRAFQSRASGDAARSVTGIMPPYTIPIRSSGCTR